MIRLRSVALVLAMLGPVAAFAAGPAGNDNPAGTVRTADGSTITLGTSLSAASAYQNQPVQYVVKVVFHGNISEVSLSDIGAGNIIVEQPKKPVIHDVVENGHVVRTAEFHYIVTPLEAGKLVIPPLTMHGKFIPPDLTSSVDTFGERLSSGVQQALDFFNANAAEPFSVTSNSVALDVKRPAAAMDPWLPLTSLKLIEDAAAPGIIHVGEPFSRKITLLADGAVGEQLPDLHKLQAPGRDFRVYADRPTMGDDIDEKNGAILGWRKESYSLVPQKSGRLVLPAVRVAWWDVVNSKPATATLPERVIEVAPGAVIQAQGTKPAATTARAPKPPAARPSPARSLLDWRVYGLAAVAAAAVLVIGLLWRGWLRRPPTSQAMREGGPVLADLDRIQSADELWRFLQAYAREHWGAPKNASLERLFGTRRSDDITAVIAGLGGALYAGKHADLEDLKQRCRRILASARKERRSRQRQGETLPGLNPG